MENKHTFIFIWVCIGSSSVCPDRMIWSEMESAAPNPDPAPGTATDSTNYQQAFLSESDCRGYQQAASHTCSSCSQTCSALHLQVSSTHLNPVYRLLSATLVSLVFVGPSWQPVRWCSDYNPAPSPQYVSGWHSSSHCYPVVLVSGEQLFGRLTYPIATTSTSSLHV